MKTLNVSLRPNIRVVNRGTQAIRKKVANMYPAHEIDEFSMRFFAIVQQSISDSEKEPKK